MSIDWKAEIEKAEQWADKKECCMKYISLAKQISDELNAYKAMWEAEFELRRKGSNKSANDSLDEYYGSGRSFS